MTARYLVALTGAAREIYCVEAEDAAEATHNWYRGTLESRECYGMGVVDVRLDDDFEAGVDE